MFMSMCAYQLHIDGDVGDQTGKEEEHGDQVRSRNKGNVDRYA